MKKPEINNQLSRFRENPTDRDLFLLILECIWGLFFMFGTLIKDICRTFSVFLKVLIIITLAILYLTVSFVSRVLGPFIMVCIGFGLWYLVTGETWLFSPDYIVAFTVFIAVVGFFRSKGYNRKWKD